MSFSIRRGNDVITSKSNPLVMRIAKLADKKYRESERLFRLDGIKLMAEALTQGAPVRYIIVREDALVRVESELSRLSENGDISLDAELTVLGDGAFAKLSDERAPEGVITVSEHMAELHTKWDGGNLSVLADEKVFMLESVRDPGNLGTVIRSAAAFGISTLILSDDCADIYNPKVLRGAMGAVFKVRTVRASDIILAISRLQGCGRRVFAAALNKESVKLGDFPLLCTDVFLVGNEGHGLSLGAIEAADKTVFIPMAENTESLNAATAASVCLWEMSKIKVR